MSKWVLNRKSLRPLFGIFLFVFIFGGVVRTSWAAVGPAKLWLAPTNETHSLGEVFSISVYVSTLNQPVNAVSGQLQFSQSNVEVANISKDGSVLTVWTEEPAYSNDKGTIRFAGGLPSPGFAGAQGLLFSISFRAIAPGPMTLVWGKSSVLANDGLGTNILGASQSAGATIQDQASSPQPEVPSAVTPVNSATAEVENKGFADEVRVVLYNKLVLFFALFTLVLLLLYWRERTYRKVQTGVTRALTGSMVEQEFSALRKDVASELWHLEKKMKRGEPFSAEERERREKLLQEIATHQKDTEERLGKI